MRIFSEIKMKFDDFYYFAQLSVSSNEWPMIQLARTIYTDFGSQVDNLRYRFQSRMVTVIEAKKREENEIINASN